MEKGTDVICECGCCGVYNVKCKFAPDRTVQQESIFTDVLTSLLLQPSCYMYTIHRQHLIGMLFLGHLHNLPVHIHIRQLRPGVLGPSVDEPPCDGEDQDPDQDHAVVVHG